MLRRENRRPKSCHNSRPATKPSTAAIRANCRKQPQQLEHDEQDSRQNQGENDLKPAHLEPQLQSFGQLAEGGLGLGASFSVCRTCFWGAGYPP